MLGAISIFEKCNILTVSAAVIIWVTLSCCTFHPDGDILTEIEVPAPTPTQIDFFDTQDTLLVRGHVSFAVSTNTPEPVKEHKLLIDDLVVNADQGRPTYVSFNSRDFSDGFHKLTMEVTKHRIGGSMASQMGVEVYEQDYTRIIEVYNKPIIAPALTATVEEGILVLHWEPYSGYRFEHYVIYCPELSMYEIIEAQEQGSIQVPGFLGGSATFSLSLFAFNESDTSGTTYESDFDAEIERTENGLRYSWLGSPFASCAGFKITMDANAQQHEVNFGNEAKVVELPASFAFPYDVSGEIYALAEDGRHVFLKAKGYNTRERIGGTNPQYHNFKQFIRHPTNDSLILIHYMDHEAETYNSQGRLALHNRATGKELKMLTGIFGISPNGQHIYHSINGNIALLDPTDLSEKEYVSYGDIAEYGNLWQFHVSDDNMLLLYVRDVGTAARGYFVYDWAARELLFTSDMTFGYGVHRTGALGNGGRQFYNIDNKQVLSIDKDPIEYFYLSDFKNEIPLTHLNRSVSTLGTDGLAVNGLPPPNQLFQISYPNAAIRIFANQQNEFGVVYIQDGKVKIDFFDHRDLSLLTTLETQLVASRASDYVYSLVENELFVYLYYNYEQGPVHHVLIDF